MFEKIIHFIKYNNATVIILAVILILGGGALAAGPEAIGQEQTSLQGIDNSLLFSLDLSNFNMDFKVENIEQDDLYYYVTYSYLDLAVIDNAWQYQLNSRTQKISKKIKGDLGEYLAKFLAKHYQSRLRELKSEQSKALASGEQKRVEVTEFTGLIGQTLDLAAKVFPGYEPVKKIQLSAPDFALPQSQITVAESDDLTKIYNDYIQSHPDLFNADQEQQEDDITTGEQSEQAAEEEETIADQELESVEIIDLPQEQEESDEPEATAQEPAEQQTTEEESASEQSASEQTQPEQPAGDESAEISAPESPAGNTASESGGEE